MSNVLLGTCIGDALGVPFETKLPNYQPLLDWDGKTFLGSAHHNLLPGKVIYITKRRVQFLPRLKPWVSLHSLWNR